MKLKIKQTVLSAVIMVLLLPLQGQNLIPDPSFELLVPQWVGEDTIWVSGSAGYPFYKPEEYLIHWKNPSSISSPDYKHLKSIGEYNPLCPAPGPQIPRTGEALVGVVTYGSVGYPNGREYLYTKLTQDLVPGKWYKAGFYVSFPDINRIANNNLGILFTSQPISTNHIYTYTANPQIESNTIVTDTANWVKIEGYFRADSSYQYFTFGNFRNDAQTNHSIVNPNQFYWDSGYYWFDDVFVIPIGAALQGDTLVCPGNKANITATGDVQWAWAEAANPSQIIGTDSILTVYPQQTSTYIFYGLTDTLTHTVEVYPVPPNPFFATDTVLCEGNTMSLQPQVGAQAQYTWQNGQQNGAFEVSAPGLYSVTITDGPCILTDAITVKYTRPAHAGLLPDTAFCPGDPIEPGVYIPYSQYLWSNGQTGNSILIDEGGSYGLQVSNACGTFELQFEVQQKDCPCNIYIPNAFTPNGDGVNETFRPITECRLMEYEWFVFDRWGKLVFSSQNPNDEWAAENYPSGLYAVKVYIRGKDNAQVKNETYYTKISIIK